MTRFSLTIEFENSSDIAYAAELVDLFINGDSAKLQPFELKLIFGMLTDQFHEYLWGRSEWDEEEVKILTEILDKMVKNATGARAYAPWDGSAEP